MLRGVPEQMKSHSGTQQGEKDMNDQNRVLCRRGARELTPEETNVVRGGFITFSLCTANPSPDGDHHPFEAGC
jgi:hypothetical protein